MNERQIVNIQAPNFIPQAAVLREEMNQPMLAADFHIQAFPGNINLTQA